MPFADNNPIKMNFRQYQNEDVRQPQNLMQDD